MPGKGFLFAPAFRFRFYFCLIFLFTALMNPSSTTTTFLFSVLKKTMPDILRKGSKTLTAACTLALASVMVVVAIRSADFATLC